MEHHLKSDKKIKKNLQSKLNSSIIGPEIGQSQSNEP